MLDEIHRRDERKSLWFDGDIIKHRRKHIREFLTKITMLDDSPSAQLTIEVFKSIYKL